MRMHRRRGTAIACVHAMPDASMWPVVGFYRIRGHGMRMLGHVIRVNRVEDQSRFSEPPRNQEKFGAEQFKHITMMVAAARSLHYC